MVPGVLLVNGRASLGSDHFTSEVAGGCLIFIKIYIYPAGIFVLASYADVLLARHAILPNERRTCDITLPRSRYFGRHATISDD